MIFVVLIHNVFPMKLRYKQVVQSTSIFSSSSDPLLPLYFFNFGWLSEWVYQKLLVSLQLYLIIILINSDLFLCVYSADIWGVLK